MTVTAQARITLADELAIRFPGEWLPVESPSDRLSECFGARVGQPAALVLKPCLARGVRRSGAAVFLGAESARTSAWFAALEVNNYAVVVAATVADAMVALAELYGAPVLVADVDREQRRAAVNAFLDDPIHTHRSANDIAARCGVSVRQVSKMRAERTSTP